MYPGNVPRYIGNCIQVSASVTGTCVTMILYEKKLDSIPHGYRTIAIPGRNLLFYHCSDGAHGRLFSCML